MVWYVDRWGISLVLVEGGRRSQYGGSALTEYDYGTTENSTSTSLSTHTYHQKFYKQVFHRRSQEAETCPPQLTFLRTSHVQGPAKRLQFKIGSEFKIRLDSANSFWPPKFAKLAILSFASPWWPGKKRPHDGLHLARQALAVFQSKTRKLRTD